MNKVELVDALAEQTGFTKKDAEAALKAFVDIVTKELAQEGSVQIVGFGAFEVTHRAARKGHNPSTGEAISIPASVSPKFKPGKALKEAVNKPKSKTRGRKKAK